MQVAFWQRAATRNREKKKQSRKHAAQLIAGFLAEGVFLPRLAAQVFCGGGGAERVVASASRSSFVVVVGLSVFLPMLAAQVGF